MPYQNNANKFREFIRNPFGLAFLVLIVLAVGILLFFSIQRLFNSSDGNYAEYDPASGEEVYFGPPTDGSESNEIVRYVGTYEILIRSGVTPEQYVAFKSAMEGYAAEKGIDLFRVSYVKDSLFIEEPCIYDFKAVLNIDKNLLNVKMDASEDCEGVEGLKIMVNEE